MRSGGKYSSVQPAYRAGGLSLSKIEDAEFSAALAALRLTENRPFCPEETPVISRSLDQAIWRRHSREGSR